MAQENYLWNCNQITSRINTEEETLRIENLIDKHFAKINETVYYTKTTKHRTHNTRS